MNDTIVEKSALTEPSGAHQALQVLTLAQRTAEDHLSRARGDAEKIRADALAKAEQIVRDAQSQSDVLQQEAEKALANAHAAAAQVVRDAETQAKHMQRDAEKILANARIRAEESAKEAQERAEELRHQAQQRYDDVVGSLATKREALQQQIEALEQFEREYRARLANFLQGQLRALWVDEPRVNPEEIEQPIPVPAGPVPAQRADSEQP